MLQIVCLLGGVIEIQKNELIFYHCAFFEVVVVVVAFYIIVFIFVFFLTDDQEFLSFVVLPVCFSGVE